ncbi:MAG: PmoA family protein [Chloroflexota bacterium]
MLNLTHIYNDTIEVGYKDQQLFHYVYIPDMPQLEAPKPYFHPMHTLAGDLITNYRPYDHIWHKGLMMTMAHLSDVNPTGEDTKANFWGGGSYVHGTGYVQLPNNGSMTHQGWDQVTCDGASVQMDERLTWLTYDGDAWIDEERQMGVHVDEAAGYWQLDYRTKLTNIHSLDVVFGSPTTAGRPNAGYGGLFWRGPRSFLNGIVLTGGGPNGDMAGPDVMGTSAAWLSYTGRHDGTANTSTMIFIDHPSNPRYPTKWFLRTDPFACASFAFSFDEELTLSPTDALDFRYRIIIANGGLERTDIEPLAQAFQGA